MEHSILVEAEHKINTEETRKIVEKLSKGKSTGIDELPDIWIHKIAAVKDEEGEPIGLNFIRDKINEVLSAAMWPKYIGEAKFIPLSKVDSSYPEEH